MKPTGTRTGFSGLIALGVGAILLLPGCAQRRQAPPAAEPFVFRSLDLRQQNDRGQPAWSLTSPEARYDLNGRRADARQPRGTIFRNGRPHITIRAGRGMVIGDGQSIELEGSVVITLLGRRPIRISGDRVRWIPRRDLMEIDRKPVASDERTRISAGSARYLLARDLVELRGGTRLEQDQRPGDDVQRGPSISVQTSAVDWKPEQGALVSAGAVRGARRTAANGRDAEASPADPQELRLEASGLRGNLREGVLDLLAPLRLSDPAGTTWLNARQSRWWIRDQRLTTDQPFEGARRSLRVRGDGLAIDLAERRLTITGACSLQQPGERLQAARCSWHWPTGAFEASGAVELNRDALGQITRATRLNGRIGREGEAVFTSPGDRVRSRLTLPSRSPDAQGPKRSRPPVQF